MNLPFPPLPHGSGNKEEMDILMSRKLRGVDVLERSKPQEALKVAVGGRTLCAGGRRARR